MGHRHFKTPLTIASTDGYSSEVSSWKENKKEHPYIIRALRMIRQNLDVSTLSNDSRGVFVGKRECGLAVQAGLLQGLDGSFILGPRQE